MPKPPIKKLYQKDNSAFNAEKYTDIFTRLAKLRVIFLSEDITKETGSFLSALLLYYNNESDVHDITIYINSDGGDATALSNIYDVMQMIEAPVQTICVGKAYSAAAILLAAGTKGKRFMTQNADVMIHGLQVQFPLFENADKTDTEIDLQISEQYNILLMKILARHTGKDYRQIAVDCKRDLFMEPKDALAYGMIDYII